MNNEIVFMSPNNGQLLIGIPLYRRSCHLTAKYKIGIYIEEDQPIAYAIDCGPEIDRIQILNAEWVESNLISLGRLWEGEL